jgi:hypothetical protein
MISTQTVSQHTFSDAPIDALRSFSAKQTVTYRPLHATFGAEVTGLEFGHVTDETVEEIKRGLAKVGTAVPI